MAKGKEKPVEPVKEAAVEEFEEVSADHVTFVERKLKAINAMTKPEKAQRLADRLLRKARK